MATNNDFENALNIMKTVPKGTTLLLHSCCAPCSSACLELLSRYFDITVLYYNPNIEDVAEYEKRKAEQIRLLNETGWGRIIDCDHSHEDFTSIVKGYEHCPEKGERCRRCYELRMRKTALTAKEKGFDYFSTTLSVSPYKISRWINEIGCELEKETGVRFLPSDFKKQGGYQRSIELSREYGLYRQNFCGCKYSKTAEEKKKDDIIYSETEANTDKPEN
ncbi:MAG: epoxyqueuosine reductase QueH [Clostridiales bacterium]|nr:epoxyqueuosine reductase QueH [Clostridiales bacterium]